MDIKPGDTIIFKERVIYSPDYRSSHFINNPKREFKVKSILEKGRLIECLVPERTGHRGSDRSSKNDRWNYESKYVLRKKFFNVLSDIKQTL